MTVAAMKCPKCGRDLKSVTTVCPFCRAAIPPETTSPSTGAVPSERAPGAASGPGGGGTWITLAQCRTLSEADAIATHLKAAGIAAFLPDEFLTQADPLQGLTHGFVRVQVPAHQHEAAKRLLSSPVETSPTEENAGLDEHESLVDASLSWPMRCVALVLPLLCFPGWMMFALIKGGYTNRRHDRKAEELLRWFVLGCALWGLAVVILLSLRRYP